VYGCDFGAVRGYVLSRRGSDGGYLSYQFMDMFESSADDTFYAIYILRRLGVEPPGLQSTVAFLRGLQVDGAYRSLPVAYYAVKALSMLGEEPYDPAAAASYIERAARESMSLVDAGAALAEEHFLGDGSLKSFDATAVIAGGEVPSGLLAASMGVEALSLLGGVPGGFAAEALRLVEGYEAPGGGYGRPVATLDSTYHAVKILSLLGRPVPREAAGWVYRCESPGGGFSVRPGVESRFLEHLYYGVEALHMAGGEPRYGGRHVELICGCQNGDGGFRRSPVLGLSTLENTYYAVAALWRMGVL